MKPTQPTSASKSDWSVAAFVFGTWAMLSVGMLAYLYAFSSPIPFFDDLAVLSDFRPGEFPTATELLKPFNGHLKPIGRTAYWLSWNLADGSVRPLLFIQALIMISSCLIVLWQLRRIRGMSSPDDVVIPLAMLAAEVWRQLTWAILLTAITATGLTTIMLVTLMRDPARLDLKGIGFFCISILYLVYQTAGGILTALGFLPFLGLLTIDRFHRGCAHRRGLGVAFVIISFIVLVSLTFQLGRPAAAIDDRASVPQIVRALAQGAAISFGGFAIAAWPLAACVAIATIAVTLFELLRRDTESFTKFDAASLLRSSLFAPSVLLVLAIGLGRGRTSGLAGHYFLAQTPLWVAVSAAWATLPSSPTKTLVLRSIALCLAVAWGLDFRPSLAFGRARRDETAQLLRDLHAGDHADRIAANHSAYWDYGRTAVYESQLGSIAALGKGPFGRLDLTPSFDFVDMRIDDCEFIDAARDGDTWSVGVSSRLAFRSDGPMDAVRITFQVPTKVGSVYMVVVPHDDSALGWAQPNLTRRNVPLPPLSHEPVTQTFVFDRATERFMLFPNDSPCDFRILRVEAGRNR